MDLTLVDDLYHTAIRLKQVELTEVQSTKFYYACQKTAIENPQLPISDLLIATRIYLNLILAFPDIDLGHIVQPLV